VSRPFELLVENVALLLSLTFLFSLVRPRLRRAPAALEDVVNGLVFAIIAILGMHTALHVVPGIIADGRVVVVALAAPFGGVRAGLIAGGLVAGYRLALGGAGAVAGTGTIVTASALGAWIRWRWGDQTHRLPPLAFLAIGIALDAIVLVWGLALPDPSVSRDVIATLFVPVGLALPLGTVLLGTLLANESRRHEERERLTLTQFTVDQAAEGLLWIDPDGRFVDANDAVCALIGLSREALRTLHVWDVDVHQSASTWPAFRRTLEHAPVLRHESEFRGAGGSLVAVAVSYKFLRFDRHRWITAFVSDVTERRQADAERAAHLAREQALRAEAEAANQLKDEFLNIVSHELRTPLTSILGYTRIVGRADVDPAARQRAADTIERNGLIQLRLVNDLLDASTILAGQLALEMKPVRLVPLVVKAFETIRPDAEAKSIAVEMTSAVTDGTMHGDARALERAVASLLSNAVKFTEPGGRITLSVDGSAERISVIVRDTGVGIAPEFLPHLFERFRQGQPPLSRTYGGLGVGLAIAREIVERHGGSISASSPGPNGGATFTITLPAATRPRDIA
jgi:PAS domain S-box-containing protein